MPVWPGDPAVIVERATGAQTEGGISLSQLTFGTHTGTHVDAPLHVLPHGNAVDRLALEALLGPAHVLHHTRAAHITAYDLEAGSIPRDCRRLLLKTPNSKRGLFSQGRLRTDYVALAADAARWLVERRLLLVGLDALSVDPYECTDLTAHRILLASGIVIVEGLSLRHVRPGDYTLHCLPLRIEGADGAPARVILSTE